MQWGEALLGRGSPSSHREHVASRLPAKGSEEVVQTTRVELAHFRLFMAFRVVKDQRKPLSEFLWCVHGYVAALPELFGENCIFLNVDALNFNTGTWSAVKQRLLMLFRLLTSTQSAQL